MQQVKKELQDAIKELKSEWGIQNANREKLASILEKVSAAVDRAAALPEVPAHPTFVGGVIYAVKKYSDTESFTIEDRNAPLDCIPALYGERGTNSAQLLMFSEIRGKMYRYTNNGNLVYEEYNDHVILCGESILMFRRNNMGNATTRLLALSSGPYTH